jgi:NAD(P)-dependent dehydrogenase (short-subunit alcohol dehydrogenase family)
MGLVDNKTCIITGAAGSLGLATAKLLASEGAKVMLVDFNAARLAEVVGEFDPATTRSCVADITCPEQVRSFVQQTVEAFGLIDLLFSNAGNDGPLSPIEHYPEDLFDKIIKTHVYGGFYTCKYAVPHMRDGGSIVITSSIVGLKGVPGNCSYVMAKHALTGLMRGLSKELGHRGIRVNTVNPGPVDNEFMRTAEKTMSAVLGRDAGAFFDEQIPLGRHAMPEEVAEAVCFLASDRSRYTNGSAIMVDGGFSS